MGLGVRVCLSPIAKGGSGPGTGTATGGPMVALGSGIAPGDPWGLTHGGRHLENLFGFLGLLCRKRCRPPSRGHGD